MTRAVVVGSGPNGLAAAITLARAGVAVTVLEASQTLGGGIRNAPERDDGTTQDHCAAFHPMAAGSPFLASLDLRQHNVIWKRAPIDCAHPLDGGDAVALYQSVTETAGGLDDDGRAWERLFAPLSRNFDKLSADIMGPLVRFPSHPVALAQFGLPALKSAAGLAQRFRTERTQALWLGIAAHAFQPLTSPMTAGIGLGITLAGHAVGWPVVEGGSGALAAALVAEVEAYGGTFETSRHIRSMKDLPPHDILILDTDPAQAATILGDTMPGRVERAFTRFRRGPAAYVMDFTIDGPIPWTHEHARVAGTVHLGGSPKEIISAEADVNRGVMPERPFVLLGQQFVADPARSNGSLNPVYAYAHVPAGYSGDASEKILRQIERFAPGFRERIVSTRIRTPQDIVAENPNFIGGDILTGAKSALQFSLGPRVTAFPYDTGVRDVYLCSAATPPGPGAHGMAGFNAATRALARLNPRSTSRGS